jgi:16S rRNA (uracil1498-N3)-methyltransferase
MRTLRFFCDDLLHGDRATLDQTQSRHLSKVLRLRVGDNIEVFDGKGLLAEAIIEVIDRDHTTVRLHKRIHIPAKTSGRVILAVSIAKGERFDWMIEKCTELGIDHIAAVHYDRTVKMGKDSAFDRYHKIALAAAKQCGRLHLPLLTGPASLEQTYANLRTLYPDAQLFFGDSEGQMFTPNTDIHKRSDVIVCIGPEGGISDTERLYFSDVKACPVCVNPNILRIETAAAAFAAVLACHTTPETPQF